MGLLADPSLPKFMCDAGAEKEFKSESQISEFPVLFDKILN